MKWLITMKTVTWNSKVKCKVRWYIISLLLFDPTGHRTNSWPILIQTMSVYIQHNDMTTTLTFWLTSMSAIPLNPSFCPVMSSTINCRAGLLRRHFEWFCKLTVLIAAWDIIGPVSVFMSVRGDQNCWTAATHQDLKVGRLRRRMQWSV